MSYLSKDSVEAKYQITKDIEARMKMFEGAVINENLYAGMMSMVSIYLKGLQEQREIFQWDASWNGSKDTLSWKVFINYPYDPHGVDGIEGSISVDGSFIQQDLQEHEDLDLMQLISEVFK